MTTVQDVQALSATINGADLHNALEVVRLAAGTGKTLPILAGTRLSAYGWNNMMEVAATDLDVSARLRIPADTGVEGDAEPVVLPVKTLNKLAKAWKGTKTYPSPTVDMRVTDDNDKVRLATSEHGNLNETDLLKMPAEDYPSLPTTDESGWVPVDLGDLSSAINRSTPHALKANQTNRLSLTGVDFVFDGNVLKLIATNGYRLSVAELGCDHPEAEILVDRDVLAQLPKMAKKLNTETAEIKVEQRDDSYNYLFVRMGDLEVAFRSIPEEFPDFERVIPTDNDIGVRVNRDQLMSALQRCQITEATESGAVVLTSHGDHLSVSSNSAEKGETEVRLEQIKMSEKIQAAFRNDYLQDALKAVKDSTEVILWLRDAESALLLEPADIPGFTYVNMPIRMDA